MAPGKRERSWASRNTNKSSGSEDTPTQRLHTYRKVLESGRNFSPAHFDSRAAVLCSTCSVPFSANGQDDAYRGLKGKLVYEVVPGEPWDVTESVGDMHACARGVQSLLPG